MDGVDFSGGNYTDFVKEVGDVTEELLRNGAQESAVHGAVEFYNRDVTSQMSNDQLAKFSGSVAWEGAVAVINTPEADPKEAYKVLGSQRNGMSHAFGLAEYGKDLDNWNEISDRAHPVLRIASEAFVEVWDDMKDRPLDERVVFYTDEYVRVAGLQNWAGDLEGEAETANSIVDAGEALFAEVKEASDEKLIGYMNDSLIKVAGSLEGGIENPRAQHLLRITTTEGKSLDFLELRKLEDTADTLLKSGMIDAAFKVYKLTFNFDPDEVRQSMEERDKLTTKEIDEHIRLVTGSFPGSPWDAILYLQGQPETEEYVDQILDRIVQEFPTTYEWFSYGQYMRDGAAYDVLINVERVEELAAIVRGNYTEDEQHSNLSFMAGRMAAMIMKAGKQELYKKVFAETEDVPGASDALQVGHDAVVDNS